MMYSILQKKKEGKALTREEIAFFVRGYTEGSIPDYQASALMMAICLQGMSHEETVILTEEMMHSGDCIDLSSFGDRSVDKHSTGGVGDKTTLILAPIVAAAGGVVAKMSGRGLGHTGGTVDKMESIPSLQTNLSPERFLETAGRVGMCVVGQSAELAPADRKLYALRDVTATVDSIPLIASSILSKKLAAGAKNIVLDVKFGQGAFMETPEEAAELAREMVLIGKSLDRRVCALLTDMNVPLGSAVGNALEIAEVIEVLSGKGDEALTELCLSLAAEMIALSLSCSREKAREKAEQMLSGGAAKERFKEWIAAQGGDPAVVEHPELLPQAPYSRTLTSCYEGYLAEMNALAIGNAAGLLGAGRRTKEDAIDPSAGIVLHKKIGDRVKFGDALATLYTSAPEKLDQAEALCREAMSFSPRKVKKTPIILDVLS